MIDEAGHGHQDAAGVQITGADRVYEAIYQAVLERRLSPGERLREQELAEQFNVSRTLVRQALQRLAQEQVIELLHNRGARVPIPSLEDAGSVFDARRVVECEVARQLAGRLSDEQLQTLQTLATSEAQADRQGEHALAIRLSGEFHQAMAQRLAAHHLLAHVALQTPRRASVCGPSPCGPDCSLAKKSRIGGR